MSVVDYSAQNRAKAYLLSIVGKLESEFKNVVISISQFKGELADVTDQQIQTDLKSIQTASETFQNLLDRCYTPEEQDKLLDAEHLREVRHDMRAAIGAIMGYTELIQDALGDLDLSAEAFKTAVGLQKIAGDFLAVIELFIIEESKSNIKENDDDIDMYMPSLVTGNVLVVDDSPQKRELLSRKLKQVGHKVKTVEDGMQALEYLRDTTPDIILLDLFMPEINGDKVLQILKKNEQLKEIPVLVVSSSSDMDNVIKCIRLGADDYLPMPVNNTLLHARINSCLMKKIARDREQKTLSELERSRQRLTTAIENIDEGFAVFDADDILITYNNCFKELYPGVKSLGGLGFTYEELIRENIRLGVYQVERRELVSNDDEETCLNEKEIEDWVSLKVSYHQNPTRAHVDLLSTGTWVEVIENKIPGGGTVSVHKDISEGKKKEERLEYLALHDGLTGLANRKKFDETLEAFFKIAQEKKTTFGIAFFDLDGFKNVNDTLGHDFGDFLLQTVSKKLVESVRESDLVARFGGDEFAALITNISSKEEMVQIAERCLESIGTQVEKDGEKANFGVSIGISLYPNNATDTTELLKKADKAMYEAKKAGKGTYRMAV